MSYLFDEQTFAQLQLAFSQCQASKERGLQHVRYVETRQADTNVFRDYVLITFEKPVGIVKSETCEFSLSDSILKGDENLTKQYQTLAETYNFDAINIAVRWVGANQGTRKIYASGFGFEFVATGDIRKTLKVEHFGINLLERAGLIDSTGIQHIQKVLLAVVNNSIFVAQHPITFFKPKIQKSKADIGEETLKNVESYIKSSISSINPKYSYDNEKALNPAFENIDTVCRALEENENRIWILRTDFVLALGIKNAYKLSFGYTGLEDAFVEKNHQYIGWDDRYGHPSLTKPHEGYDGSSYYAGYVAQREDHLEVLLFSGRYYRDDLSLEKIKLLEAYVASRFQQAYGNQSVEFIDISGYKDYFDLSIFLNNLSFPETYTKRRYTQESIREVLEQASDVGSTGVCKKSI